MRKYIFLLFIIVVGFNVNDIRKERIELNWTIDLDNSGKRILTFENAFFHENSPSIPVYSKIVSLKDVHGDINYVVENTVFEELPDDIYFEAGLDSNITVEQQKVASNGISKVHLNITPLKRVENKLYILKSFDLKQMPVQVKSAKRNLFEWKSQSVLNSGKWVKVSTNERGIYKIPHSKLAEWGFSNPQLVNIFGSGGADLSENPGNIDFDDLNQNTVWHGTNNGESCLFFCVQAPISWEFNSSDNRFQHSVNCYTNKGFYFLTDEVGESKNLELISEVAEIPTHQVSSFNDYVLHEQELVNVIPHGSGRQWFGESIRAGSGKSIEMDLIDPDTDEKLTVTINSIGRSYKGSELEVSINTENVGNMVFGKVNTGSQTDKFADQEKESYEVNSTPNLKVELKYLADNADNNATSWLDYIEVNYKRLLRASSKPVFFREIGSVGEGNIAEYTIGNCTANTKVLNIEDSYNIKEVPVQVNAGNAKFKQSAETLKEYVVYNEDGEFLEPEFVGEVENQNLHALEVPEFVIISHPGFESAANNLANFHRSFDEMSVEVVTTDQVFNEFSSGTKNATGIRNFIKMMYDKGTSLKYVLLLGDGSYDNRNIKQGNKNFIPTYQSGNSLVPTSSFVTDDYYVILDADESVYDGAVDLGIGRIPASILYEADVVVDKILNYYSPESLGEWKNVVCFIGDDENGNLHMKDTERLADKVNKNHREFITDKIYFDSYKQEVSPAGESYPGVTEAINKRVKDGVLVLNYTGHANNRYMADERVLDISHVNSWSNANNLPIFVTATCEFSRFDANETSIGEYVLFNPNGGGIGLFSTTRVVFAYSNYLLSQSFYDYVFAKDENGKRYRMGDIIRLAKTNTINSTNKRNFSLLGDPALKLSYPGAKVVTTKINGKDADVETDTIGALQTIDVEGYVADFNDKMIDDFTGEISLTVYDKSIVMKTLGNAGETPMSFDVQQNILYKGLASVNNGQFSFRFVVPKDIAYNLDKGKIMYYASDENRDAGGAFENFIIGGSSGETVPDNTGPEIELYMDTENFVSGGETSKSPTLLAFLSDENGINTVGSGIGHDITAVIDNDYSNVLVLNDFYQADIDDYTSGRIVFPMKNLSVGKHTLLLKAWDVANNSSEVEIEFEVSGEFKISSVSNYPNPMNEYTYFVFEHNQAGAMLDAIVEIFDQNGRRVDYLTTQVGSNGITSNPIRWDMNEVNMQLRSGIYIYRIMVQNSDGVLASKSGKIVIAN